MIKGKTPEEIRKLFNIVNDFTPEEEAQIKKENVRIIPPSSPSPFHCKPYLRLRIPASHRLPLAAITDACFFSGMGRGPLDARHMY